MKLEQKAFREVTEKAGFDINAGQNIDMSKSLKETIDYVVKYIDEGKKGCCFHASVYLMKLLHDSQIDSEIILTVEPTKLENGEVRNDLRASVLVNNGIKCFVMNPIEDIEFFESEKIPVESRKNYYGDTTILRGKKDGICSLDAAKIELEDFITRYGNGKAWTIGNLYCDGYENIPFGNLMNNAKIIDTSDYLRTQIKF